VTPPALFCEGFFEIGSHEVFAWLALNLSDSWVAGITGVSHWHPEKIPYYKISLLTIPEANTACSAMYQALFYCFFSSPCWRWHPGPSVWKQALCCWAIPLALGVVSSSSHIQIS
jgi:hypothetical protein